VAGLKQTSGVGLLLARVGIGMLAKEECMALSSFLRRFLSCVGILNLQLHPGLEGPMPTESPLLALQAYWTATTPPSRSLSWRPARCW
jgi:hypothetical protein